MGHYSNQMRNSWWKDLHFTIKLKGNYLKDTCRWHPQGICDKPEYIILFVCSGCLDNFPIFFFTNSTSFSLTCQPSPSLSSYLIFSSTDPKFHFSLQLCSRSLSFFTASHPAQQFPLHLQPYSCLIQLTTTKVTGKNDHKRMSKNCWPMSKVKSPRKNGKEAVGLIIKSDLI